MWRLLFLVFFFYEYQAWCNLLAFLTPAVNLNHSLDEVAEWPSRQCYAKQKGIRLKLIALHVFPIATFFVAALLVDKIIWNFPRSSPRHLTHLVTPLGRQVDGLSAHVRYRPPERAELSGVGILEHQLLRSWAQHCSRLLRLQQLSEKLRKRQSLISQVGRFWGHLEWEKWLIYTFY